MLEGMNDLPTKRWNSCKVPQTTSQSCFQERGYWRLRFTIPRRRAGTRYLAMNLQVLVMGLTLFCVLVFQKRQSLLALAYAASNSSLALHVMTEVHNCRRRIPPSKTVCILIDAAFFRLNPSQFSGSVCFTSRVLPADADFLLSKKCIMFVDCI